MQYSWCLEYVDQNCSPCESFMGPIRWLSLLGLGNMFNEVVLILGPTNLMSTSIGLFAYSELDYLLTVLNWSEFDIYDSIPQRTIITWFWHPVHLFLCQYLPIYHNWKMLNLAVMYNTLFENSKVTWSHGPPLGWICTLIACWSCRICDADTCQVKHFQI